MHSKGWGFVMYGNSMCGDEGRTERGICRECGGEGCFECMECYGAGYWIEEDGEKVICPVCQGEGKVICENCEGKGEVEYFV